MAIAGVAFLGVASVATAQAPKPGQAGSRKASGEGMSRLFNGINLTDAQKAQVKQIQDKYKALRESMSGSRSRAEGQQDEGARARRAEIMAKANEEYRAILTADQQKIFDQNVAKKNERMKQREKEGPRSRT